jgi:hypothetical protein
LSLSSGEPAGPPHEIGEMPKKTKYVEDIKWRPHSREFAALTTGGRVFVFESPDFKTIASDMILLHGWRLAYSPDGRLLAAGKSTTSEDFDPAPPDAGNIAIVDSQTLSLIGSKRLAKYTQVVTHIAFLNNATLFFSTYRDVYSLDVAHLGQSEPQLFYSCRAVCNQLRVSPDGKDLAIADGHDVILRHLQ